jgi:hypothetical protein
MQRLQDAVAAVLPDVPEVGPPAELVNEFVLHVQHMALGHAGQHVGERDEAVRDVGRQLADGATDRVARACIGCRPHGGDPDLRRRQRGDEHRREPGR